MLQNAGAQVSPNIQSADISHWWGQDWTLTPAGDVQLVDSIPKDNQRIFRRLCTNGSQSGAMIGEYFFHLDYGGSAPWYVGQTTDALLLEGVIRQQMYMETAVSHSPEPTISTTFAADGSYQAVIQYTDNRTSQPVPPLVMTVSS